MRNAMQCRARCRSLIFWLDEKEPTCSPCERLGYSCPGTQSKTVFVDENTRFEGNKSVSNEQPLFPSSDASHSHSASTDSISTEVVAAVPSQEIWLRAQSSARGESLDASGRWNLNLPKNVYYTSFVVDRLNIGRIQSAFSFLRSGLAARHGDSYLPYLFTRSFAKAFFGQYYRMPGVVAEAQADYGNQLLILKQDLSSPESTDYPSLFYGIMAAVMYEFVTMTTPYAWSWHVSALARMVEVSILPTCPLAPTQLVNMVSWSESWSRGVSTVSRCGWTCHMSPVPRSHCKHHALAMKKPVANGELMHSTIDRQCYVISETNLPRAPRVDDR